MQPTHYMLNAEQETHVDQKEAIVDDGENPS